jgi:hypothetical protein
MQVGAATAVRDIEQQCAGGLPSCVSLLPLRERKYEAANVRERPQHPSVIELNWRGELARP